MEDFSDTFRRINEAMAKSVRADMKRTLNFYRGYTQLEADVWLRFNRCCHPGRKILLKDRPFRVRIAP